MTMLNHAHVEAICSATYLQNYLDCLDALPDELQRTLSQIREIDVKIHELESDSISFDDVIQALAENDLPDTNVIIKLQKMFIKMQELEDEKIQLSASLMDFIDNRSRQLDADRENLDPANHMVNEAPPPRAAKQESRKSATNEIKNGTPTLNGSSNNENGRDSARQHDTKQSSSTAKKRRHKAESANTSVSRSSGHAKSSHSTSNSNNTVGSTPTRDKDETVSSNRKNTTSNHDDTNSRSRLPPKRKRRSKASSQSRNQISKEIKEPSIEPDEPTYCLCDQISYGEMIGCDNDACPIEWFHFNCVGLVNKPKGRWYCPKCRGDKPTVMKKTDKR